jgi:hypothetical protein
MDPTVSTSFIPKKNLDGGSRRGRGSATGFVLLLAILFFITSLVAAGAVFGYTGLLKQSIASKANSLALNEKAYDPGVIQELIRIDNRLKEAKSLLSSHIAPSAIFAFLSQQTLEKVQFTSFDYEIGKDGGAEISLSGLADSFSTVALQSDQFGASKVLKDVVFSEVNIDPTSGKVAFAVKASVIPSLILFKNVLVANPAGVVPQDSTPQTPTTTP